MMGLLVGTHQRGAAAHSRRDPVAVHASCSECHAQRTSARRMSTTQRGVGMPRTICGTPSATGSTSLTTRQSPTHFASSQAMVASAR